MYAFFSSGAWSPVNAVVADITPDKGLGMGRGLYFMAESLAASITPAEEEAVLGLFCIRFASPFSAAFLTASLAAPQFLRC
ncbi:MAG: hypothetical protein JTT11_07440 [Candidatus Brockarchaeota archaeon]|nr:hypothetical protein [Candidatus Brockarchaeota archaeon]